MEIKNRLSIGLYKQNFILKVFSFLQYEKLSQIGGSNLGNAVRRMLKKIMTDKLATSFSWVGIKGKEPFATLKIASILFSKLQSFFT